MQAFRSRGVARRAAAMSRRSFLGATAVAGITPAFLVRRLHAAQPGAYAAVTSFEEAMAKVKPHLQCGDEATQRFAVNAYWQCLLNKITPAEPPLRQPHIPAGGYYGHFQGLWDNMFIVDGISVLPEYRQLAYGILQNVFDFQAWWDANTPEYRHGMMTNQTRPDPAGWVKSLHFSELPLVGWGVDRVYRRTGNMEVVKTFLKPLEKFHEWYWRERDVADTGLIGVGSYTGDVQDARYETFDFECNLDDLKMTVHPRRKGPNEGRWYGDISIPGTTAYLLLGERCLARLAELAGDHAMAQRRRKRLDRGVAAMHEHMWDEQAGTFVAVQRDSLKKIRIATIGSWVPLLAEVPTREMAARMAERLATSDWMTPLPVPTVARSDPRWESGGAHFWRGDVWAPTNYQIADGLTRYGYKELAARIVDASVANAMKVGISERYDSVSGKAMGVVGLPMSFTLLTMLLDGLSQRYVVKTVA